MSGRRDSNPRPLAWKANALSTELLPHTLYLQKCRAKIQYFLKRQKSISFQLFKAYCFEFSSEIPDVKNPLKPLNSRQNPLNSAVS